ncbi:MAG: TonB-dependent receptor [Prevotella sp.]|nr:TonB-dependent receptor [Prevotella sp.]
MNRLIIIFLLLFSAMAATAQGLVKGRVLDKTNNEPLSFVNVKISNQGSDALVKGAVTDTEGHFSIDGLKNGQYTLTLTFVGYRNVVRNFVVNDRNRSHNFPALYMSEDAHQLKEVTVTGQRSAMKLEVDRKSFDVSQLVTNAGASASEALENIPSVEVDNDGNVSLRGNTSVEVWINGKASGLTTDNRAEILQQLPAESIDHVEVIDNPSAKFSAEGSAGIINIVLKKDLKPGYYGSLQAGANTQGGANTSFNINYNSPIIDTYLNVGFRHREGEGRTESEQEYLQTNQYQWYKAKNSNMGNNLFGRAGLTFHVTKKDDISLSGMMMKGRNKNWSTTPYHYGTIGAASDTRLMTRRNTGGGNMNMLYGEFNYRHSFTDTHYLDFVVGFNRWKSDNDAFYQDSTVTYFEPYTTTYSYQSRPRHMNNRSMEVKLDYENPISENMKLQAGYQGRFSHENTPQESFIDNTSWDGHNAVEDKLYFNRFIYDMDLHALYTTITYKWNKFGIMAGMRGEYWKVNTESYTWEQEHDASKRDLPFKKDYFQLFPSVFLSYQITDNDQLQLNYTRRLRRPWGGQLNSFKDTRDATTVSFGNPELTPEFSNSFSLNYLKTWTEHSMMLSAYYRPTSDVIQRISWQSSTDGLIYNTSKNLAKSLSSGFELTVKNKLFRILDLTTSANAYYYKLNGFSYDIDGQTVRGEENHNFTWNARMTASLILPYDISIQTTGRYRSRQVITQGYRKPGYGVDFGLRKNFLNKKLTLAITCRDVLNSRRFENFVESETFTRHQLNKRNSRTVNFTLTWNFGNMMPKRKDMPGMGMDGEEGMEGAEGMGAPMNNNMLNNNNRNNNTNNNNRNNNQAQREEQSGGGEEE